MFNHTVFKLHNLLVSSYNLQNNYKLVIPFNLLYLKTQYKDMLRFNTFILKTFSIHWIRVVFRGKGFRLRKIKELNKLTLNFGHSH